MKNIFVIATIVSMAEFSFILPLSAACQAKSAAREEIKVAIPFAVPVGVPVATFAPYFYSYQQFQLKTPEPMGNPPAASTPSASSNPTAATA
jgi:hypothetical protein